MIAGPPVLAYPGEHLACLQKPRRLSVSGPPREAIAPMVVMVSRLSRLRRLVIFSTPIPVTRLEQDGHRPKVGGALGICAGRMHIAARLARHDRGSSPVAGAAGRLLRGPQTMRSPRTPDRDMAN